MMNRIIGELLIRISIRVRIQQCFNSLNRGLFFASVVGIFLILLRFFFPIAQQPSWWWFGIPLFLGIVLSGVVGFFLPVDPKEIAEKIDAHYRLKDRFLTSWRLMQHDSKTLMEQIQIDDTVLHVAKIDVNNVVPFHVPRSFSWSILMLVAALGLCTISASVSFDRIKPPVNGVPPLDELIAVNDRIRKETVEKIEKIAQKNQDEPSLRELAEKMNELSKRLTRFSADPKESLAVLSQMDSSIQKTIDAFDLGATDASLSEIGESLGAAKSGQSASRLLKDKNYEKAANELKQVEPSEMSKPERDTIADRLKTDSSAMNTRNQRNLATLTKKWAGELKEGNDTEFKKTAAEQADLVQKQGIRKEIAQSLDNQLALLGENKAQASTANHSQSDQNGQSSNQHSSNPSQIWGKGTTGDSRGKEESPLDSKRVRQQLTGIRGIGPSEKEIIRSVEGRDETATIAYKERYHQYQKEMESVLETEPIPLGKRQMIRHYFESIRPQETTNKNTEAGADAKEL